MEVRTHYTSAGLSLNDHVHKGVIDVYEWGLLRAFKNVKSVTPEIKHKPFFEGFLIHTPGSYPELILNVLLCLFSCHTL